MKYFITFGAGIYRYADAVNRLVNQATNLELFDKIIGYNDSYLRNDIEFWNQHSTFIENNRRGYGYWLWKSYIIKKTMESMKDGDVLLYLDCGCELDIRKKEQIAHFLEVVKNEYIIGAESGQIEKKYNKMDLIIKLNTLDEKYFDTIQHQAGAILFLFVIKREIL